MKVLKYRTGSHGGKYFQVKSENVSAQEIHEIVRSEPVKFEPASSEVVALITCLKWAEKNSNTYLKLRPGDSMRALMNRIIRGGGFVEYIEKLEAR